MIKHWILGLIAIMAGGTGCVCADTVQADTVQEEDRQQTAIHKEDYELWFGIHNIDDEIFSRIKGKSYKDDCTVPLDDLRYLTVAYYGEGGEIKKGEIICNKAIASDLEDIFRNLFKARYPIESIRLVDDFEADDIKSMQSNNTSCFNFRKVAGSNKLSKHALGLAIDINPLYNPYVKTKNGVTTVSPEEGRRYSDRKGDFPYKIDVDDLCYKEFIAHGFKWGGAWKSLKDYQHFEK